MRGFMITAAAAVAALLSANAFAQQTCLRPMWTECVSLPNGGRVAGVNPQGAHVEMAVPPASEVCVINNEEIRAETYAQFARNGMPWPNPDWVVNNDDFCLYRN